MNRARCLGWVFTWIAACAAAGCSPSGDSEAPLSVGGRLSGDTAGYPKVTVPRELRYPADHGPHPEYKHEWWYLTGQLTTDDGRRFGFQLTIFRESISPTPADSASRWATSQLYLAHAALTDVQGGRYLSDERFARGALELAGARAAPFRVWLEDWRMTGRTDGQGGLIANVAAESDGFGFDLEIRSTRPPVAHGNRGMSFKGSEGNASYYYSYTRLEARGTVRLDGEDFQAGGGAWFDHEWSSSALSADQSGWDWFSLRLSDGTDLMVFRLRDKGDPKEDFYSGTLVRRDGGKTILSTGEIDLRALDHWTSDSGIRYPVRWRLSVPAQDLELTIEPWLEDQEFAHSFRYWEGAVGATGRHAGARVEAEGYVELAGYSASRER